MGAPVRFLKWALPLAGVVLLTAFALVQVLSPRAAAQQEPALPVAIADAIRTDVASRTPNGQPSQVVIARVEVVTWRDGCMGIYAPEVACTLALVPGYVVWATYQNAGFRYHTDQTSTVLFAADGIAPGSIPTAPLPDGIVEEDGTGTILAGEIPQEGGFGLIVFGGGSYSQLVVATGCPLETARFWVTNNGQFVLLVPISEVAAVNAPFDALFGGTISPATPMIGTCPPPVTTSGVEGTVIRGPIEPVCIEGQPCDGPYSALLVVLDGSGKQVASATSSAVDGSYRIPLPPGSYTLVPEDPPGPFPSPPPPIDFVVEAGKFTRVDVAYDTGIR